MVMTFRDRVVIAARNLAWSYVNGPQFPENARLTGLARYVLSAPPAAPVFDELALRARGPGGENTRADCPGLIQVLTAVWPGVAATDYRTAREPVA